MCNAHGAARDCVDCGDIVRRANRHTVPILILGKSKELALAVEVESLSKPKQAIFKRLDQSCIVMNELSMPI